MEFNRNQIFMLGMLVLLLGVQLRLVETFVLNEKASRFLSEKLRVATGGESSMGSILPAVGPTPRRTIHPPDWLGFALISVGAVLMLHSLAMKKPGG